MSYDWKFSRLEPYAAAFAHGATTTIALTLLVVVIGTLLGVLIGVLLARSPRRWMAQLSIDVIRAVPPLVLLFFFYYLLVPGIIGFSVSSFFVAAIALSLNLAVFTADVVRSAIQDVPKPIRDAARALGMDSKSIRRHIVLPWVMRDILPAMTVLYIGMLKISSLASVINVRETVYAAQTVIAEISRSLEAWIIVALIYIVLVTPATYIGRRIESWGARGREGLQP